MKILHTSDWHLGQSFYTKSRRLEHQAFLDWLLNQVKDQGVDAVIVAGDVFDTGAPPSYAREIYNQFIVELSHVGCTLVVLGGNHDSVAMLNESRNLAAILNTHVVAGVVTGEGAVADESAQGLHSERQYLSDQRLFDQHIVPLKNSEGELGAVLCAIPFIRPRDVISSSAGASGLEKRQALGEAIKTFYAQVYKAAQDYCQAEGVQVPIIATGHLTALGVKASESVRDIYIGTLDGFAADGFPPADYIALGHIHRPQLVAKHEHVRYSGSPIPLSFDELKTQKQVVLVEFNDQGERVISTLDVPRFQPMAVIKTTLDNLEAQIIATYHREVTELFDTSFVNTSFANTNVSNKKSELSNAQSLWLSIEIQTQTYLSDLSERVQAIVEGLTQDKVNVDVLQLRRARDTSRETLTQDAQETLSELTPTEVFDKRLALESFDSEEDAARLERIKQQFQQVLIDVEQPEQSD